MAKKQTQKVPKPEKQPQGDPSLGAVKNDGLEKLKNLGLSPAPGQPQEAPPGSGDPVSPVSGLVKRSYPFILDMLCHVLGKEVLPKEQKDGLMDFLAPDLDEIDRKWITPMVGDHAEYKVIGATVIAVGSQAKAKKPEKAPAKTTDSPVVVATQGQPEKVASPAPGQPQEAPPGSPG